MISIDGPKQPESIFSSVVDWCSEIANTDLKISRKFDELVVSSKEALQNCCSKAFSTETEQPLIFQENRFAVIYQEEINDEIPSIAEEPKHILSIIGEFLLHIYTIIRNLLFAEKSIELKENDSIEHVLRQSATISEEEYQKYHEIIQMIPTDKAIGWWDTGALAAAFFKRFKVTEKGAMENHFLNFLAIAFDEKHKELTKKLFELNEKTFLDYANLCLKGFPAQPNFAQRVLDFTTLAKLDHQTVATFFNANDLKGLLDFLKTK